MSRNPSHPVILAGLFAFVVACAVPELLRERIFPWDSALYAANGAMFQSLLQDLGGFISSPMGWVQAYYDQYPALAIRRQPPLFGVVESIVYAFTGVGVFGAKLTLTLFSLLLAGGTYAFAFWIWRDKVTAAVTTLITLLAPLVLVFSGSVWLDIPALAFTSLAIGFYWRYFEGDRPRDLGLVVVFGVLALYTYQLAVFSLIGLVLHLIVFRGLSVLKSRRVVLAGGATLLLLSPLVVEQLYFAADNLSAASGSKVEGWEAFQPYQGRATIKYWLHYPALMLRTHPLQAAGLLLWAALFLRTPRGLERQRQSLFLFCLAPALMFFSWTLSKNDRYLLYVVVSATPLVVVGVKGAAGRLAADRKWLTEFGWAIPLLVFAIAQAGTVDVRVTKLSGMDEVVRNVLEEVPSPTVYYQGDLDTCFIFYLRSQDPHRGASVFRGSGETTRGRELAEFVEANGVDVVILQRGIDPEAAAQHGEGDASFLQFLDESSVFRRREDHALQRDGRKGTRSVPLTVYTAAR